MATLSELIGLTLNKETPGVIIPEGAENQLNATDISSLGLLKTLPKIKIWFITEQNTATAQITSNPTESGRIQNDNIILDPLTWSIRAKVTDVMGKFTLNDLTSLAGAFAANLAPGAGAFFRRAGSGVSNSVYDYLLRLRDQRRPFSLVTSFGKKSNLYFENIVFDRNVDTANSLPIQMTLKELFISNAVILASDQPIEPAQGFTSIISSSQNLGIQQGVSF